MMGVGGGLLGTELPAPEIAYPIPIASPPVSARVAEDARERGTSGHPCLGERSQSRRTTMGLPIGVTPPGSLKTLPPRIAQNKSSAWPTCHNLHPGTTPPSGNPSHTAIVPAWWVPAGRSMGNLAGLPEGHPGLRPGLLWGLGARGYGRLAYPPRAISSLDRISCRDGLDWWVLKMPGGPGKECELRDAACLRAVGPDRLQGAFPDCSRKHMVGRRRLAPARARLWKLQTGSSRGVASPGNLARMACRPASRAAAGGLAVHVSASGVACTGRGQS